MQQKGSVIQTIINPIKGILEDQIIIENIKDFKVVGISNDLIVVKYATKAKDIYLEVFDFNTFAPVWKKLLKKDDRPILMNDDVLVFNQIDPFISYFDLATSSNLATANISQYFGNDLSTVTDAYEEADDQIEPPSEISMNLLTLLPLKTKLMGVIEIDKKQRLVFLSNIKE